MTVHDVLAWEHPEWIGRANVLQHRLVLERVLPARGGRADVVAVHARRAARAAAASTPSACVVAPLGVDAAFSPGPGGVAGVEGPYLLAVGTLQPRKDLETALRRLRALRRRGRAHALVVAGARGWRDEETVARLRASRTAPGSHLLGRVDDDALVAALRGADALLYPSRYEGFGLPPLEAMACGTPVVAARATGSCRRSPATPRCSSSPATRGAFADAVAACSATTRRGGSCASAACDGRRSSPGRGAPT